MPEQKGRKSTRDRERERRRTRTEPAADGIDDTDATNAPEVTVATPAASPRAAAPPPPQPSSATRASGVMLAFVTAIIGVWLLYDALSGDSEGAEVIGRLIAGVLMLGLAAVVGVLSVAPEVARKILRRFMAGRYRVEDGDTLESIARRTGFSVRDLQTINPELTGALVPGSTVYLPRPKRR